MTSEELLKRLDYDHLKISLNDGQLSLTGEKSKITPQILSEIQKNKSNLILLLSDGSQQSGESTPGVRRYCREDGSYFELNSDEFAALVEFFELINSLICVEESA